MGQVDVLSEGSGGRPSVAARSQWLRCLIATLVVGMYWGLGRLLGLSLAEYQLLGLPFLFLFQWAVQRQPIRTLWVRAGTPLTVDAKFIALWVVCALVPAYETALAVRHLAFASAGLYATGIPGAFGLTYALRNMRAVTMRQVAWCLLTAGAIGLAPELLVLVGHLHVHVNGAAQGGGAARHPHLLRGLQTLLWGLPAGFMIEEVFFRGALDTYVHQGEGGTGWLSAIFISALWGLWHLPASALGHPHLLSTILRLLGAQILVGVPLSLWWRKSGNLAVNNTTHAVIDAVRAVL